MTVPMILQLDSKQGGSHYGLYHHISESDICFFLREYTAGKDYSYSESNSLIKNLKISLSEQHRLHYKNYAINTCATELVKTDFIKKYAKDITFIPVPPSIKKGEEGYDNRLIQVLELMKLALPELDYREIVLQSHTTRKSHASDGNRLTPAELQKIYTVNQSILINTKPFLFIFDDVLTTGSHFLAVKNTILNSQPNAQIYGLFIARVERCYPFKDIEEINF